jgi:hypothetical protein
MALVTALVTLGLVTVLGIALTSAGMLAVTVATNDRDTNEVLGIADAGLTHARSLLMNQVWIAPPLPAGAGPYDQLLQVGNGTACDGDEFSARPSNAMQPYPDVAELIPQAGRAFPAGNAFGGRYEVRLCDDHSVESAAATPDTNPNHDQNRRILARSHGFGRNGAEATVEALFTERPMPGLLVNGNMAVDGTLNVLGSEGGVHANGDVDLNGTSMCMQQFYSAVGTITPMTAGNGGSCPYANVPKLPGSDPIPVPKLDLGDPMWPLMSSYILSNGNQYCGPTNTDAARCPVVSSYNSATSTWTLAPVVGGTGFSYNSGQKKWSSNNPLTGTYYVDENVGLGGSFGPIALTIFARGWVDISGSPDMMPAIPPSVNGAYAIVAGTDLQITGDLLASPTFSGLYYARDQVKFAGNVTVNGLVVSGNFSDCRWPLGTYVCNPDVTDNNNDNLVKRDSTGFVNTGNGSVTITYNDDSGWKSLRIASWRECRGTGPGANPANPCGNP